MAMEEERQNGDLREPLLEENNHHKNTTNLLASASLLSLATFSWLNPLLALGFRKHLLIDDVPPLLPRDQGKALFSAFDTTWEALKTAPSRSSQIPSLARPQTPSITSQTPSRAASQTPSITSQTSSRAASQTPSLGSHDETPSIALALVKMFWVSMVGMGFLTAVNAVAHFVGPYLVDDFVELLHGRRRFEKEGWVLVACFVGANVVANLTQNYYTLAMFQFNVRVRTCLTSMIYRKSLRLSSISRKRRTTAEIINYMAVDTERVVSLSWWVHDLWILPLQVSLALAILRKNVGLAPAGAALGTTVATLLLNSPLVALESRFQKQLMGAKDARMKTTSECLRNMRILKLQAWETEFLSQIEQLRASEYACLVKRMYSIAASSLLLWTSPTLVAITTFTTCIYLGIPLTPGRVLSSIATFAILRQPLQFIPQLASLLVDAHVSLHRLRSFLQEPELPEDAVESGGDGEVAVEVKDGVFSWNEEGLATLRGVNLSVRRGAHVAVCGQVGSGKSALLACLLGEIPKLEGRVRVEGRTAYVAQTPWIQSGTVKENVCFGRSIDEELYEKVLQACDLKRDIALFPFGDETGIGERGINLSGGQKQRVQLARALYQEADVYFLDDPFSAVDAHTGSHLLKECIMGFLASKTVVYVTHQMESLYSADHILVLRDGVIIQAGKYDDLLRMGSEFNTLVTAHNKALEEMHMSANMSNGEFDYHFERNGGSHFSDELDYQQDTRLNGRSASNGGSHLGGEEANDCINGLKDEEVALLRSEAQQLIQDDERGTGSVPFHVFWAYATIVAGGALIPVYILSQVAFQAIQIFNSYWMAWGTSSAAHVSLYELISVYSLLGAFGAVFVLLKIITVSITGLKAGQKYFTKMLRSVFRAPMSFFDSTPSGRIISRMSGDQETVDTQMLFTLNSFMNDLVVLAGILALMSQITSHILLLVLPIAVACILYQRYNIASGRELARIGRYLKAPIINHYGESIAGATTIRGFHQEERFMDLNLDHLDRFGTILFHKGAVREWLTMRVEMLSTLGYALFLIFLITLPQGYMNPSLAGVAITYAINLGAALESLVINVGQLETTVIAVERILQYCTLPSEPPLVIENVRPAQNWPSQGTIRICNLQIRYNTHSPLVLHGLSCTFNGGEKVGIVGRTGSGKSTLIQALFRVVEPVGGRIEIDKLDISTIGLHDLRSGLSIIPQDPTLFEGSMRTNLDPLGKYSDAEIWEALDKCQLGDIIRAAENKLETSVGENGENWSVGQRQLVCLGRALLKQTRILVLDEATASVDSATDALIQKTLRKEFSSCTVITIAHRIPTIVDSDKVLVLDNGRVVEHNSPTALLQDQSSFFSKLVMEYSTRFTENEKI